MIFYTQAPKLQLSHDLLRNADLMGGATVGSNHTEFSQSLAFDSGRKTLCLMQKCKFKF